ncbi:thiamine pyrophosphokinase [Xylariaceae sp. FL1019]|nr:thiamine pyrophosphokinase [Xylariaceae sp. FL1019]
MSPPGTEDTIEWYPIRSLSGDPNHPFSLVVLNQPICDSGMFSDLWDIADTKIAADGGANRIYNLTQIPKAQNENSMARSEPHGFKNLDTIIGDLDSLSAESRNYFSQSHIIHDPDQYSTDFTKAVRHARLERPSTDLICMGGLGGRVDQGLSQLHHLYMFQTSPTYEDGRMYLLSGESLSFLLKGGKRHLIRVREPDAVVKKDFKRVSANPFGKHAGIVPVGEAARITLKGFEWDVEDWPTRFGGQMSTSNHVLPETEVLEVESDKDVLFTIALK